MTQGRGRLRRADRLKSSRDFGRVSRQGRRRASSHFVLVAGTRRGGGSARVGLTVSRKVGNAVVRNRIKRHIREWFRTRRGELPRFDLVVIARGPSASLDGPGTAAELNALTRGLGAAE